MQKNKNYIMTGENGQIMGIMGLGLDSCLTQKPEPIIINQDGFYIAVKSPAALQLLLYLLFAFESVN
jgi:hypothetical protein